MASRSSEMGAASQSLRLEEAHYAPPHISKPISARARRCDGRSLALHPAHTLGLRLSPAKPAGLLVIDIPAAASRPAIDDECALAGVGEAWFAEASRAIAAEEYHASASAAGLQAPASGPIRQPAPPPPPTGRRTTPVLPPPADRYDP
jgi:hypothetical protein